MSGKGSWKRPCSTTREEQNLRDRYARGEITLRQFNKKFENLKKRGLIKRNGKTLN